MTELSKEYLEAIEASNVVSREHTKAQEQYRKCEIDREQFLAIRAKFAESLREFDKAYDKEQRRQEQAEREARFNPDEILQMELLK